jgi:two-component system nitrogen regulation response regulator NtrX
MTQEDVIQGKHIPPPFNRSSDAKEAFESALMLDSLKEARSRFEKAFIESKLKEFNGNISQTAEAIGIERSNLHRKIKAFGLTGRGT